MCVPVSFHKCWLTNGNMRLSMSCSRMQHNTALLYRKGCLAYAAKLITSTLKKNFCQLYFNLHKLWNEKHVRITCRAKNYVYTIMDGKCWCGKPSMILVLCWSNFHATQHSATCCSMQKLCRSCTVLASTQFLTQSHIVLYSVTWHSVDAPLWLKNSLKLQIAIQIFF